MPGDSDCTEVRLVNGSTGDPGLFIDYTGKDDALLFDAGENGSLDSARLGDLDAVFITHHHVDHFIGLDRIVRANLDRDKALHIYGPTGTITKVYDRIKSYEYPFFPFQKIVLKVHEILEGRIRAAHLECSRRFPKPEIEEKDWQGPLIHETQLLRVEAALVDHTVPCLAFALVEPEGLEPDPAKIAANGLPKGAWIGRAVKMQKNGAPIDTALTVGGEKRALGWVLEQAFSNVPGRRIAYVTDTAWSETSKPGLLRLAHKARRLYCDSFYAEAQRSQAEKYRHMLAGQAGELARLAEVEELVLIHFSARYEGQYQKLLDEAKAVFPNVRAEF